MSELKLRLHSFSPTSENGALLPAACVLLLMAGAAVQLTLPQDSAMPQAASAGRPPQWSLPEVGEPEVPPAAAQVWLFTPTRLGEAMAAVVSGDTAEAPKVKPVGPLSGAYVLGAMRLGAHRAVVLKDAGGHVGRLGLGGGYRGWRLVSIEDDDAVFRKGGKAKRIEYGSTPASSDAGTDSENTSE